MRNEALVSTLIWKLFEWDAEEGGRNLKALPHVMDWFERGKL